MERFSPDIHPILRFRHMAPICWIFLLILIEQCQTTRIRTTPGVAIHLDGLTREQWEQESIWNQTRTLIVNHLNSFCHSDPHCQADYGVDNLHLLHLTQSNPSTLRVNISVDEPILNHADHDQQSQQYNYTALLTAALFQAKIDLEHLHDNQRTDRIFPPSNRRNGDGPSRFLLILMGIFLVTLIFALTVLFFQRIRQHHYTNLLKQSTSNSGGGVEVLTN